MKHSSCGGLKQDTLPNAIVQENRCWSALHNAAASGDEKQLQILLDKNVVRTSKESKHGNTPLHEAAWCGYSRCVKILCTPNNTKVDLKNKKQKNGASEARIALHNLILNIQNQEGFSPLHLAAQNGHNQSCRELLWAGADPDVQNFYGDTALHTSCRYGHAGATRILLSASCDPNKMNLNGDSPLHISCAMGKRKLTRVLLEAECEINLRNGQNETPRDIAVRKQHIEIVDMLSNQRRMCNVRDKSKVKTAKTKVEQTECINGARWSPYGCHYFPDPRSFPSPKLETLPKEPLKKGEQYFLDLAGHIRKGPIGVGNTCYCGPFFRHIEDKINYNRKKLKKFVHRVEESLENKVQSLAIQTNDQIEQITRSMVEDRVRCESRRMHMDCWLKRCDALRTMDEQNAIKLKCKQANMEGSLVRSRSLELFSKDEPSNAVNELVNSKSCSILELTDTDEPMQYTKTSLDRRLQSEENETEIEHDDDDEDEANPYEDCSGNYASKNDITEMMTYHNKANDYEKASCSSGTDVNVIERRAAIYYETDEPSDSVTTTVFNNSNNSISINNNVSLANIYPNQLNDMPIARHKNYLFNTYAESLAQREENRDKHLLSGWHNEEPIRLNNEHLLETVISALHKNSNQRISAEAETKELNQTENINEDKLGYKGEKAQLQIVKDANNSSILQDTHAMNLTKARARSQIVNQNVAKAAQNNESLVPQQRTYRPEYRLIAPKQHKCISNDLENSMEQRVRSTIEKFEIKNSEIKLLKKSLDSDHSRVDSSQLPYAANMSLKLTGLTNNSAYHLSSDDEQKTFRDFQSVYDSPSLELQQQQQQNYIQTPKPALLNNDNHPNLAQQTLIKPQAQLEQVIPKNAYYYNLTDKHRYKNWQNNNTNFGRTEATCYRQTQADNAYTNAQHYMQHNADFENTLHNSRMLAASSVQLVKPPSFKINHRELNHSKTHETTLANSNMFLYQEIAPEMIKKQENFAERDISNDSGFSTRTSCHLDRPSPNQLLLSNYTTETMQPTYNLSHTTEHMLTSTGAHITDNSSSSSKNQHVLQNVVEFHCNNASSLV